MSLWFQRLIIVLCVLVAVGICYVFAIRFGPPSDWVVYRLAAEALLRGETPYVIDHEYQFYNPPWALLPLIPLVLLPFPLDAMGSLLLTMVGVLGICYYTRMSSKVAIVWLLTPPVITCILTGQIDWMVLYGFFCPPVLAFFLLMIKPQVGLGMAVYLFVRLWQQRNLSYAMRKAAPALAWLGLSFIAYGPWPLNALAMAGREAAQWPTTLWPQAVPVGLGLLYWALRKRKAKAAMAAGPCLSSHVIPSSWMGALLALNDEPVVLLIVSVSMWVVLILYTLRVL